MEYLSYDIDFITEKYFYYVIATIKTAALHC